MSFYRLAFAIVLTLLLLLVGCRRPQPTPEIATDDTLEARREPSSFVTIFLVNANPDADVAAAEAVGCGDRLEPVVVAAERSDLASTIRALLSQSDTLGLENVVHDGGGARLDSALVEDGMARVYLAGRFQIRGICDHPRISGQLTATARIASSADSVAIFVDGEPLDEYLSLR